MNDWISNISITFIILLGWINNIYSQASFITTWQTDNLGSSCSSCITIPTVSGESYDYHVDWDNDGIFDEFGLNGDVTHDFGEVGTYTIAIEGQFPRIYFNNVGDAVKLISINQWGDIQWTSMERAFYGCINLLIDASDTPNLSQVTTMAAMFHSCRVMNTDLNDWDVSTVTNMDSMFYLCAKFNGAIGAWDMGNVNTTKSMFSICYKLDQDLNDWDMSKVTDMSNMFNMCNKFNGNIGDWDVSNVKFMNHLFSSCILLNQDLNRWDVGQVIDMKSMFLSCLDFNQDLNNWDVSNVITMTAMFAFCDSFNSDISDWNVSNVNDMSSMFSYAPNFNVDISTWDVGNVSNMKDMFLGCRSFNQNIDSWNVSNVRSFTGMFSECSVFNQDLNNWNTSNAQVMAGMFRDCPKFNGNILDWDVSNVFSFEVMFANGIQFNQNLSNWNVSSVKFMENMFDNAGLDCQNYSATLQGWADNSLTPSDITLGSQGMEYGDMAIEARELLLSTKGWTIIGDTQVECAVATSDYIAEPIIVYPNPVQDVLFIKGIAHVSLHLKDIAGRVVMSRLVTDQLNLRDLDSGLYFLEIFDTDGSLLSNQKVVKE